MIFDPNKNPKAISLDDVLELKVNNENPEGVVFVVTVKGNWIVKEKIYMGNGYIWHRKIGNKFFHETDVRRCHAILTVIKEWVDKHAIKGKPSLSVVK